MPRDKLTRQIDNLRYYAFRRLRLGLEKEFGPLHWRIEGGSRVTMIGEARVQINFRVIRTSDGQVAGWPTAIVYGRCPQKASSHFLTPLLAGNGATPANLAKAIRHYNEEAVCQ